MYYYKYNFTSPEGVYSIIREELKSYMDTAGVDDLLFPTYLDKCLRKLGRATYPISQEILYLDDFQARLPDNFYAVREAWLCTEIEQFPYQTANSFYSQAATATTIQVAPLVIGGTPCQKHQCYEPTCDMCMPELVQAVYKTNNELTRGYRREYLLKPGNISAMKSCSVEYVHGWEDHVGSFTPHSSDYDSFDIRDNKFVTNFRHGVVNLVFYATEYDDLQNQMIPDNYYIREYIEAFIKYKMFETLTNQINDETFNQLREKLMYYKQQSDEAYIRAEVELKKQTIWEKQRRVKETANRNNMYELPGTNVRYGWRRNT